MLYRKCCWVNRVRETFLSESKTFLSWLQVRVRPGTTPLSFFSSCLSDKEAEKDTQFSYRFSLLFSLLFYRRSSSSGYKKSPTHQKTLCTLTSFSSARKYRSLAKKNHTLQWAFFPKDAFHSDLALDEKKMSFAAEGIKEEAEGLQTSVLSAIAQCFSTKGTTLFSKKNTSLI